jgi:hypothetical protein
MNKIKCFKNVTGTWTIVCPDLRIQGRTHQFERSNWTMALGMIQDRVRLIEEDLKWKAHLQAIATRRHSSL